ncbi:MAG: hypothetical protein DRJ67_10285, partial [Thermoprotei archaeon]
MEMECVAVLSGECLFRLISRMEDVVVRRVGEFQRNREALEREAFPSGPLKLVVEAIVTQSWWRRNRWNMLLDALRERDYSRWRKPLIRLEDLAFMAETMEFLYKSRKGRWWRDAAESLRFREAALREAGSLKAWVAEVHRAVDEMGGNWRRHEYVSGIKGLGFKGINDVLRSLGYFDHAPMDIHERRFLLRTGVALKYGPPSGDPWSPEFCLEALRRFCREELSGYEVS